MAAGTLRWAVLGTGGVSRRFVYGLRAAGMAASVVAGRRAEAARSFAAALGVAHAAEDYAAAAAHPEADAVYIATPPALHQEHALAAIAAGKAVLVEKPMALDAAAAARIAEAARTAGVFAMEAMWTRFLPAVRTAAAMAGDGRLGTLHGFDGGFFGAVVPDPAASIFDPARGGGALMHRGVYPLSLAALLLGPVARVQAVGRIGATGVDEDCVLALTHASGALSTVRASYAVSAPSEARVMGSAGTLTMGPVWRPERLSLTRTAAARTGPGRPSRLEALRDGPVLSALRQRLGPTLQALRGRGPARLPARFAANGFQYQALEVARCVAEGLGESPVMPLDESVALMRLVDEARAQMGVEVPA